ncbi:MAG: PA2169 family four-helix-bundle protein [Candidatus Korobacteraceae bacterium]
MQDQRHIADALEKLIEVCRDGQNGYRDAAEHAKDPQLKKFLNEVSLERAKFAGDLESEAVRQGKSDVDRAGSTLGAIHRGWTDLKTNLGGGDNAILSSMETGDSYARDRYDKVIREGKLPDDVLGIVRNQAQALVGTLDRVRALRQHRKAA